MEKNKLPELKENLEQQKVAPGYRSYRSRIIIGYLLIAIPSFLVLAFFARSFPYFPVDLVVTKFIQGLNNPVFYWIMVVVSGIGYEPYQSLIVASTVIILFLIKLRKESVILLISTLLISTIGVLIKSFVDRPRPSLDLVSVIRHSADPSFPSGHVLSYVVFYGFLWFIIFTSFKKSVWRNAALVILAIPLTLVGLSRVYLGAHWFSDVVGAYLLGSSWLLGTILIYQRVRTKRS